MIQQTIKSAELYEENSKYYLDLRYVIENQNEIREYHIPKVRLPIEFAQMESETHCTGDDHLYLKLPDQKLALEKGYARINFASNSSRHFHDVYYGSAVIKDKRKVEMTIEEIEKKLGHKIKIVNNH